MNTTTPDKEATMKRRSAFGHLHRRKRPDGTYKPGWYLRIRRGEESPVVWAGPDYRTATKYQAELERKAAQEEILEERPLADATFADLERPLLQSLAAAHAATTAVAEKGRIARMVAHFGSRLLREIETSDLQDFLDGLRKIRVRRNPRTVVEGGPASSATKNRYASALAVAFDLAVEKGYAKKNPAKGLRRYAEDTHPVPFLSDEEIDRVVAAATEPRFRALLRVLADAGLRRSEVGRLEWRDVDLRRRVLLVRRSKTRRPREVPLTELAHDALAGLAGDTATGALGLATPVWPEFFGHLNRIEGRFRRLTKRLGVKLRLHDLRHGFCSLQAQSGTPIPTIQQLAGHASAATTMRYASHLPGGATQEAIRRRDEIRRAAAQKGHPQGHPEARAVPEARPPAA
jgi:integrase